MELQLGKPQADDSVCDHGERSDNAVSPKNSTADEPLESVARGGLRYLRGINVMREGNKGEKGAQSPGPGSVLAVKRRGGLEPRQKLGY